MESQEFHIGEVELAVQGLEKFLKTDLEFSKEYSETVSELASRLLTCANKIQGIYTGGAENPHE